MSDVQQRGVAKRIRLSREGESGGVHRSIVFYKGS